MTRIAHPDDRLDLGTSGARVDVGISGRDALIRIASATKNVVKDLCTLKTSRTGVTSYSRITALQ